MTVTKLSEDVYVSPQIEVEELQKLKASGIASIVNNRPDEEEVGQPTMQALAAAADGLGLEYRHIPVVPGEITATDIQDFSAAVNTLPKPVLAFCRSGLRAASLWALDRVRDHDPDMLIKQCASAGYDISGLRPRLNAVRDISRGSADSGQDDQKIIVYDVVIVGGGAGGIAVAASLLKRRPSTSVAIVEPSETHHYQAAFTLVGGGTFLDEKTRRSEQNCIPANAHWVRAAVAGFDPEKGRILLEDGEPIGYRLLVVCPGIKLDWSRVDGLRETLGKNGVTSNYLPGLAPYTWECIQKTQRGNALFTQPPMPIKCAGAPQKIMYLASDYWRRTGVIDDLHVQFNSAGDVLFGVGAFVAPLMKYVEQYGIDLAFGSNLVAVDGPAKKAWFDVKGEDGSVTRVVKSFDMLHVSPPQCAPDFIAESSLADDAGWVDVDPDTLRHKRFENIFGLGDACSAPNAKTAAAVRKQAPVVVQNLIAMLDGKAEEAVYDGYGSCPLVVERGKVIFAEFGYGGKLMPTFPLDPTVPRRSMWLLKNKFLPFLYWDILFKGRQWLAEPKTFRQTTVRTISEPDRTLSIPADDDGSAHKIDWSR